MSIRTLAPLLAAAEATNSSDLASLKEQEKRRRASHREPLKQRERALRSDATLKELHVLRRDIMEELPDDDPLVKKIAASIHARSAAARSPLEEALSPNQAGKMTCARAETVLAQCVKELDPNDILIDKAKEVLSARRKTHRQVLIPEVTAAADAQKASSRHGSGGGGLTVIALDTLYRKLLTELSDTDELVQKVVSLRSKREASHREPLVQEYSQLMRDIAKITVGELNSFAAKCALELPPDDAIFGQIESAHETKVMTKHTIDLDKVERGENTMHDNGGSSGSGVGGDESGKKKPSKKVSKDKSSSSSSKHKSSSSSSSFSASSALSNVPFAPTISGLFKDLDGRPPAEGRGFKLLMFAVFLVYCSLISYSSFLFLKVDKTSKFISGGAVGLLQAGLDADITKSGSGTSSVISPSLGGSNGGRNANDKSAVDSSTSSANAKSTAQIEPIKTVSDNGGGGGNGGGNGQSSDSQDKDDDGGDDDDGDD